MISKSGLELHKEPYTAYTTQELESQISGIYISANLSEIEYFVLKFLMESDSSQGLQEYVKENTMEIISDKPRIRQHVYTLRKKIEPFDFPVFVLNDDKGNYYFGGIDFNRIQKFEGLCFDPLSRIYFSEDLIKKGRIDKPDEIYQLSYYYARLLEYFWENNGIIEHETMGLSKQTDFPTDIKALKNLLAKADANDLLNPVWGIGYRFGNPDDFYPINWGNTRYNPELGIYKTDELEGRLGAGSYLINYLFSVKSASKYELSHNIEWPKHSYNPASVLILISRLRKKGFPINCKENRYSIHA